MQTASPEQPHLALFEVTLGCFLLPSAVVRAAEPLEWSAEALQGVDCSAAPLGKIAFGTLTADKHRHTAVEELQLRNAGIDLWARPSWNELQKVLKKAEKCGGKSKKKFWFKPVAERLKAHPSLRAARRPPPNDSDGNEDGSGEQVVLWQQMCHCSKSLIGVQRACDLEDWEGGEVHSDTMGRRLCAR
jgi:hypothetical protein